MLSATELRIGNYVYDTLGKVNQIDLEAITYIIKEPLNQVQPIPLTEEWLLKFGFYKNIDTELFEKDGFQIDLSVIKCLFYLPEFGDWYKELEYVHQLQNLFYCLCGEELTLNNQL
jgi:hypothetical protein